MTQIATDMVGRTLAPGDLVAYAVSGRTSGILCVGEILSINWEGRIRPYSLKIQPLQGSQYRPRPRPTTFRKIKQVLRLDNMSVPSAWPVEDD